MGIINIKRVGSKVVVDLVTALPHPDGGTVLFSHDYDHGKCYYASAVLSHINERIAKAMRNERRHAYNEGWHDAKAKRGGKRAYFSGELP